MMRQPLTWIVILALWILGGAWYGKSTCCGGAATAPLSGLLIKDGTKTVAATATGNLLFAQSGARPIVEDNEVKKELGNLATYLQENPNRSLTLYGQYLSSENNTTSFANLGMARADELKGYLISLGAPANAILTDSKEVEDLTQQDNRYVGAMEYVFDNLGASRELTIKDGSNFSLHVEDNLVFPKSAYAYTSPLSKEVEAGFEKLADYLKSHPSRALRITGFYSEEETNNSVLPNLGMARANDVKGILTEMGVSAKQVEIDARMINTLSFSEGETIGAASYSFFDSSSSKDKLTEVENRLRAQPLILYFETNAERIKLSAQQRQYLADLMYYLENKEGARAIAVGHTDNRGAQTLNNRLSQKRAKFVKDYLGRNGIDQGLISAVGKGPTQPIANNETDEGRAQNRRVEISIK